MPEDCVVEGDAESYRKYYIEHKRDIATWSSRRGTPYWWR